MKKLLIILTLIILFFNSAKAEISNQNMTVISDNGYFGLQDDEGNITVKPKFKKLIRLGTASWIFQKNGKYGVINNCGDILIEPKYRHVDRILGKYVKLGNGFHYGIFDQNGKTILPLEYSSINLMFGGMFLTCKDYKYGIASTSGKIILENKFEDIYMPKPNIMRLQYNGQWYEIEQIAGGEFVPPDDIKNISQNDEFLVTTFMKDPVIVSGYSAVTFTDYILKLFSSISPAHEETIDELMFSQGADTVSIFMRFAWLPKYPFTYAQKYYQALRTPNNGPLSKVKDGLKQKFN